MQSDKLVQRAELQMQTARYCSAAALNTIQKHVTCYVYELLYLGLWGLVRLRLLSFGIQHREVWYLDTNILEETVTLMYIEE
jgi:hypothetical protein